MWVMVPRPVIQKAVPVTVYTHIASPEPKRAWITLTNMSVGSNRCYIFMPKDQEYTTYGILELIPGDAITFSATGDMPWTGTIDAMGIGGTAVIYGSEIVWEQR